MPDPTFEPVIPGRPEQPLPSPEGRPVLFVRDPTSAYFFWPTAEGDGLRRLVLRISSEDGVVREHDFQAGMGGRYLENLASGRGYRAEVFIRDAAGTPTPHSAPSGPTALPPAGSSARLEVMTFAAPDVCNPGLDAEGPRLDVALSAAD